MQENPWTKGNQFIGYDHIKRRVWVLNQRLHHGTVGIIAIAIGSVLALHDRKDWRDWFKKGL